MVVEIVLGERAEERGAVGRTGRAGAVDTPPALRVTPGAALPEELLRQLEDMRAGIMPAPGARSRIPTVDELRARSGASSSSHSFSFSFGNGAQTSSHSMASDGEGSVSLEEKDGKKHAVVKDRDGKTLFEGDVTDRPSKSFRPTSVVASSSSRARASACLASRAARRPRRLRPKSRRRSSIRSRGLELPAARVGR
jgi:hypothetical protein